MRNVEAEVCTKMELSYPGLRSFTSNFCGFDILMKVEERVKARLGFMAWHIIRAIEANHDGRDGHGAR